MCLCPDLLVGNFAANGELPEKQAGLELMCQLNSEFAQSISSVGGKKIQCLLPVRDCSELLMEWEERTGKRECCKDYAVAVVVMLWLQLSDC